MTNVAPIPVTHPRTGFTSPRSKLVRHGADTLTDAELLAIQLPHLPPRVAATVAHEALLEAGDLRRLLELARDEMTGLPGIGDREHVALCAALEIGRRYVATSVKPGDVIQNPKDLADYFTARVRHHKTEHFVVLFLTTRHHVIACEVLSQGTLDGTTVYEREVLRRALHHHAGAVVLCHNHPSGIVTASQSDRQLTVNLVSVLALIQVRVLDHLIIGEESAFSFVEHGLL